MRSAAMKKAIRKLGIGSLLALSAVGPASAQQAPTADSVVLLDQAWSQADRETYYQITQGSSVLDYDIFLNLELANSQELFRSDANSERYGFTPQAANPRTNPDALPVGLAKTVNTEGRWKGEYVGPTCAACHNTQLTYKGKGIRMEGASNNNRDFTAMI